MTTETESQRQEMKKFLLGDGQQQQIDCYFEFAHGRASMQVMHASEMIRITAQRNEISMIDQLPGVNVRVEVWGIPRIIISEGSLL